MDSRSSGTSSSSASASLSPFWKKFVGGICFGSPTTTSCFARAITPIASHTGICEASSNTTRSNGAASGGRYCATESGLMRKHGLRTAVSDGVSASSWRTGLCRAFFSHSRRRMPSSLAAGQSSARRRGRRAASRANTSPFASSRDFSSSARKRITRSS